MSSNSLVDNVLASISKLRRRTSLRESLRSFRSNSSTANSIKSKKETSSLRRTSSYYPYSVYEQRMTPIILRDPEATRKLLEAILDSPNGKRALSRLARTCRALSEPALNILWRDLDSIVPVIGLFPGHILKKARKPGLGLAKVPQEGDWKHVLAYSERIQRLAYDENSNAAAPSIFSILEEYRPRAYLFPNLQELSWKVETAAGLDRCQLFLNPKLQSINLEVGTKIPHLNTFLEDISSRLQLVGFSFVSPTSLPDSYTKLLRRQNKLERVALVAPGALGPDVGRQVASLPQLKNLQLDLTGRSMIAVEGFFDELEPRSGDSTPSSVGSTDSGVFSGEELDFSGIRKSALRLTGDLPSKGSFSQLRRLHLTGDVSNIAVFIKHLTSPLVQLELVIEDPPDNADWQDLSSLICERFSESIQSLRITATSSSRFVDLVRSTSRAEPASGRLSLEHLTSLPALTRLDIDLPESVVFTAADIACLAKACPNLEMLRLCPLARFPQTSGPPKVTLEDLAPIVTECKRLHTLAVVFNAKQGSAEVLASRTASSPSLLRLHTGHSWISDPLQVSILLSHLAPNLESLKWFQEKNRPGFVEANAKNWQMTCDILPHLQGLRSAERAFAKAPVQIRPKMLNKGIDASVKTVNRGVIAQVRTADSSIQCTPRIVNRGIDAVPKAFSTAVDATPRTRETSIDATPLTVSTAVDASVFGVSKSVETTPISKTVTWPSQHLYLSGYLPSVLGFFSFAYRIFIFFPFSLSSRILQLALARLPHVQKKRGDTGNSVASENTPSSTVNIPLDTLQDTLHAFSYNTYAYAHAYEIHAFSSLQEITFFKKMTMSASQFQRTNSVAEVDVATWGKLAGEGQTNTNIVATRHFSTQTSRKSPSWNYIMSDNKKQEKDYTKEVDELLPEADALVKSGKLQEGLDKIFSLEKQTRNASDLSSTTRLAKAAVQHCYDARDYTLVNSTLSILSKKHGQLKAAIQAIVELAISWLDEIKQKDGVEKWLELVETLRTVTEGKIFLETPRARVTLALAHYHEGLSKSTQDPKESLRTASDLLSDLQVETYSSMERREKTEFILEQMRLLVGVARQKDAEVGKEGKDSLGGGEGEWVKVRVGGRKVNEEFLKDKANEDLKLKYYDLMIQHALQHSSYLDVAKYYYKVWETPSIKEDVNDKGKSALEHIVYYVVLAPHNNEQSDMLYHLFVDPALTRLELHYNLVKCFTTRELMRWPGIEMIYGRFLRKTPVFESEKRWEDLHTRVIEHNIRVVAQYYTRITLVRLTSLLDLTLPQTEEILARLVVSGSIWARIDRPAGIVNFRSKRSAEDVMNDWSSDMQKLLGLVEKTWMGMNAAQAAQSRVKS